MTETVKKPTLKRFPCSGALADAVSSFYSTCAELRDEARDVFDNMPESLQQGDRGQTFEQTANALDEFCDDEPEVPAEAELACSWTENRRKSPSRRTRMDNAVAAADAAISAIEERVAELDDEVEDDAAGESHEALEELKTELEELRERLENDKAIAEECEFPGMYG